MSNSQTISNETSKNSDTLIDRARQLGLWGALAHWDEIEHEPWLGDLMEWEERERHQRSLDRRIHNARIGRYKPMADFDWSWPEQIDRDQVEELFNFGFIQEQANVVLIGPNGVGKSMIGKNIAYQAALEGHTVFFTTAAQMLTDLSAQETSTTLRRRLTRYCRPGLLVIDEVGYLSYDNRHADLLFEVVTQRYNEKSTIVTTNKVFSDWNEVFPNAACVVTLVDRLVHQSEIIEIKGESYRLKEAKERTAKRAKERAAKKKAANAKKRSRSSKGVK